MGQNRYAYLVGANGPAIRGETLKYAERDARLLAEVWRDPHGLCKFTAVKDVVAASHATIADDFLEFIQQCGEDDVVIFHFAGHGIFYKQQLYLVCNNTNIERFMTTSIKVNDIKACFQECRSRYKALILDCCHAAGAHNGGVYGTRGVEDVPGALIQTMQGSADLILSACSQNEKARELEALDGGSGFLSWAIRAACSTRFQDVTLSSSPRALSFHQLCNWLPVAQKEVNALYNVYPPLPLPRTIEEKSSNGEIWLTDSPPKNFTRPDSSAAARRQYLQYVTKKYSLVTLPIGGVDDPLSLQAIFQPLELKSDPLTVENLGPKQRRRLLGEQKDEETASFFLVQEENQPQHSSENSNHRPVIAKHGEEALLKSPQRRLVILGGPGTGKTTTLKYLVNQSVENALANETAPLPVFLSLADLARTGQTLRQYLKDMLENVTIERGYADVLWRAIEGGNAFVALDSLDEVSPELRPKMIELINYLALTPGNTWIIGSRFTEYKGGQFKAGSFAEWELLPMNPELQNVLAEKLFAVFQNNMGSFSSTISASYFLAVLKAHGHASDWGQNPLLLSLAALIYVKTGHLPASRVLLYKEVVNAIVAFRTKDGIHSKQLLRTFSGLAYWLYLQRKGRTFTNDDILNFLERVQRRSWRETHEIAGELIASGLLDVVAHETYGFQHQTFQEYLVAVELSNMMVSGDTQERKEGWDFAWSKRMYSRWAEILCMLAGCLYQSPSSHSQVLLEKWLVSLLQQRESREGDIGNFGLALTIRSIAELNDIFEQPGRVVIGLGKRVVSLWLRELVGAKNSRSKKLEALSREIGTLHHGWTHETVDQIRECFQSRNKIVVESIQNALNVFGRYGHLELLMILMQDKDLYVRRAAAQALSQQGERVPLELWQQWMQDDDGDVRSAVVHVLSQQRKRVPVELWQQWMQDDNLYVRRAAAQALGQQGERIPLELWQQWMQDKDPYVRSAVVETLGQQGEWVPLELWQQWMQDDDGDVRRVAVEALRYQRKRVPVELWQQWMQDDNKDVRIVVAEVLGQQGERIPLELWQQWMQDKDLYVRRAVVQALGQQGERIPLELWQQWMQDKDPYVRRAVVQALRYQRERVPVELWQQWMQDKDLQVRRAVAQARIRKRKRVPLELWQQWMQDDDLHVRRAAVEALGQQGEQVPVELWQQWMQDKDPYVRSAVVEALSQQGERVPVELWQQWMQDDDGDVRSVVVHVLSQQRKRVPLELWQQWMQDDDLHVRVAVVKALGQQGERVPVELWQQWMQDKDPYVRRAVVDALGQQGERVPVELWQQWMQDDDEDVRRAVVASLVRFYIVDKQSLKAFHYIVDFRIKEVAIWILDNEDIYFFIKDKNSSVRRAVVQALGQQGERVPVELWQQWIQDDDEDVRIAVVQALGQQGERVPVELWQQWMQDKDWRVRVAVVEALGQQGEQVPVELWQQWMRDKDWRVRVAVAEALGQQGERVPVELWQQWMQDDDEDVRGAVAEALGQQGERVLIELWQQWMQDKAWRARVAVAEALGQQGERMPVELWQQWMQVNDKNIRIAIVRALGQQGERVPLELWQQWMQDKDWRVRRAVVRALGRQRERVPVELWQQWMQDDDGDVRIAVVEAQGEQLPLELWQQWMQVNDKNIRIAIVRALGQQGERIPLELWQQWMQIEDWRVRRAVVQALGQQGKRVSLELWQQWMKDKDWRVRSAVVEALGKQVVRVHESLFIDALQDSSTVVSANAAYILKKFYHNILSDFIPDVKETIRTGICTCEVLRTPMYTRAAEMLGELKLATPAVLEYLSDLLDHAHWQVRLAAIQALGEIRRNIPDRAIRRLMEIRLDPTMGRACAAADDALAEILSLENGIEDD